MGQIGYSESVSLEDMDANTNETAVTEEAKVEEETTEKIVEE